MATADTGAAYESAFSHGILFLRKRKPLCTTHFAAERVAHSVPNEGVRSSTRFSLAVDAVSGRTCSFANPVFTSALMACDFTERGTVGPHEAKQTPHGPNQSTAAMHNVASAALHHCRLWRNDCHKMVLMLCSAQKKPSYIGADTSSQYRTDPSAHSGARRNRPLLFDSHAHGLVRWEAARCERDEPAQRRDRLLYTVMS